MVRAHTKKYARRFAPRVRRGKRSYEGGHCSQGSPLQSRSALFYQRFTLVTKRPRPIPTFGLTHLALGVADVERAFGFYEAVFGMVATYRSESFLQAETPGLRDILVFEKRPGATGASADIAHFGFRVKSPEDLKNAAAVVTAAGGTIVEEGEFMSGEPYLFARDRDGYLLEIWYELK